MRLACFALLVLAAGSARAEDVENPEFASWSKFKTGAAVTHKSISTINGRASEQTQTHTLVEVAADKVVVEMRVTIVVQGNVLKPNAVRQEISKALVIPKGAKKADVLAGKPEGTFDEGAEILKLDGKELRTRWFKYKTETGGRVIQGQKWLSADVPGLLVRQHESTGGAVPVDSVLDLVEIKRP